MKKSKLIIPASAQILSRSEQRAVLGGVSNNEDVLSNPRCSEFCKLGPVVDSLRCMRGRCPKCAVIGIEPEGYGTCVTSVIEE